MIVETLCAVLGFIVYKALSLGFVKHLISGSYRSLKLFEAERLIKRLREGKTSRLNLYDYLSNDDLKKNGVIIPDEEWELECPRELRDPNVTDEVLFSGSNSQGGSVIVRIVRRYDGYGEAWVYVQLNDGKRYVLPEKDATRMPLGDGRSFRVGGLRIECLLPMRKWRIAFNGLLCQMDQPGDQVKDEIHMKFNFLWSPLSHSYDFETDTHPSLLASVLAENKWSKMKTLAKTLVKGQDKYQQFGQFMGTVEIDNVEIVHHFWGIKSRSLDTLSSDTLNYQVRRIRSYHGHDKLGTFFEVGIDTSLDDCRLIYGYVVLLDGIVSPIKSWTDIRSDGNSFHVKIEADQDYILEIKESETWSKFSHRLGRQGETTFSKIKISMNGQPGHGISLMEKTSPLHLRPEDNVSSSITKNNDNKVDALVLPFYDPRCMEVERSGGKGASLAFLTVVSKESKECYSVPRGFVVTTSSYRLVKNKEIELLLKTLEQAAWGNLKESLENVCARVMKAFTDVKFPDKIEEELRQNLQRIFGSDYSLKKFAVRSSATGEDSEELSAAGQMDTFLGVQGFQNILTAVKKCWASQFSVIATNYKKNNGQLIDSDMAVVIQEMVPSDVAGVMFTCDPSSGDPRYIYITANYGLGESVVSATSDPDTITLRKTRDNLCSIQKVQAGGKKIGIFMNKDSGTKEEEISHEKASICCLSEDKAVLLGKIGIELEERFGAPRDIEWAIIENEVYLLQARPVTSIYAETDYEIAHELDTAYRLENNYATRANVGEVYPNAISFLTLGQFFSVSFVQHRMDISFSGIRNAFRPYHILRGLLISLNHIFFNLSEGFFQFTRKDEESMLNKASTISIFGRELDLDDLREIGYARMKNSSRKENLLSKMAGLKCGLGLLWKMFTCGKKVKNAYKSTWNLKITFEEGDSAIDMIQTIGKNIGIGLEAREAFVTSIISSSMSNMILLSILENASEGLKSETYSDFAMLLSSCNAVESADVPISLKKLASLITKCPGGEEFKTMDPKKAEEWLRTSEVGGEFQKFLERHGHRCFKEFDFQASPWRENAEQLIKSLQGLVGNVKGTEHDKEQLSIEDAIKKISIPLNWTKKTLLKLVLRWCRFCVGYREQAKSLEIKGVDRFRKAYRKLASKMVSEGFLPDEDLFYYLTFDEIWILLNTRAPRLVAKAKRRRRYFPTLNCMQFPEIIQGIIQPVNCVPTNVQDSASLIMTGTPVSSGVVTALARVAKSLEEAAELKPGEILITYCTDIGWSPYFPLISGIATELGGLISHGAVIAREYGLPCVVGVHGATSVFKTGDMVLLDGKRGILQRIDHDNEGA